MSAQVDTSRRGSRPRAAITAGWGTEVVAERLGAVLDCTPAGASVLDLGCAQGAYVRALASLNRRAVGVDLDPRASWRGGRYVAGSGERLPFAGRGFHTVAAFEVLEHCPHPEAVAREMARCASSHLVLSVPNCEHRETLERYSLALAHWTDTSHVCFFTKASIAALVAGAGARVESISDCYAVRPADHFWDTLRVPRLLARIGKRLCRSLRLSPVYWSSILVVASVPRG